MGLANCEQGFQSQKSWDQQQILAIPVSHSSISMSNTTGVFCRETLTLLWECYSHQRWWQISPFIRPGFLSGFQELVAGGKWENKVRIKCGESLMHSAWG